MTTERSWNATATLEAHAMQQANVDQDVTLMMASRVCSLFPVGGCLAKMAQGDGPPTNPRGWTFTRNESVREMRWDQEHIAGGFGLEGATERVRPRLMPGSEESGRTTVEESVVKGTVR
jgi:hypothetical protein